MSSGPCLNDLERRNSSSSALSSFFDRFRRRLLSRNLLKTSMPFENEPTIEITQLATFVYAMASLSAALGSDGEYQVRSLISSNNRRLATSHRHTGPENRPAALSPQRGSRRSIICMQHRAFNEAPRLARGPGRAKWPALAEREHGQ